MMRSEMEDEMEEGELPEEGELDDNDDASTSMKDKKQSKTSKGASESAQTSVTISAKEEARVDTSAESGEGDVKEFIKKKRKELAEKVKSQLLAGVESRLGSGSMSDEDNEKKKTVQSESPASESASKSSKATSKESTAIAVAPATTKESAHSSSKYRDFDKVTDPTETMMSNWMSRGKRKRTLLDSPTGQDDNEQTDPNEEYYGTVDAIASPPPLDSGAVGGGQDQDYRMMATGDQDYRIPPPQPTPQFDVDYRRDMRRRPSDDDSVHEYGGQADDVRKKPLLPSGPSNAPPDANEFGDIDERFQPAGGSSSRHHDRRPKRPQSDDSGSESPDDDDRRGSKKRRRSPTSSTGRRRGGGSGPVGRWGGGERPICKFYREGYCREGDSCSFSHDLEPSWKPAEKRPELCRFYLSGYCRNGRRCPFMHGEFPCKDFHKGQCSKGDECRFSHEPLNDVTRPLFEQMLKDEDLAAKVSVPNAKSTRKVLLGAPPPPMAMKMSPPRHGPSPPPMMQMGNQMRQGFRSPSPPSSYFHPPSQFDQFGPNQGPPFFNNAPMPGRGISPPYGPSGPTNMGFGPPNQVMESFHPPFMPPPQQPNPLPPMDSGPSGDNVSMHTMAMLRQIKAQMTEGDVEESPASPEPSAEPHDTKSTGPRTIAHVVYRLIPVDIPPRNKSVLSAALIQASLTDSKLRGDPRIKHLLQSQFNAGSDIFLQQPAKDAIPQQMMQQQGRDPRSRATRDPRLSRQQQATTATTTASTSQSDMYGYQQQAMGSDQGNMRFDNNPGFSMEPMMGGGQGPGPFFPTPPNSAFGAASNSMVAPGGWMPQVNLVGSSTSAPGMGMNNLPSYMDPIQQQFPPSGPPQQLLNGPVRSSPPQMHHYSGPLMADSPPSSGGRRNSFLAHRRPSPNQNDDRDRDMRREYFPSSTNGGPYGQDKDPDEDMPSAPPAQEMSMRERRKDLLYESPLN